jgi:hypothetical protein
MSRKGDDENDDWCAVCREKGDLLMCDGCCLSFHCGCIGYLDVDFLPDDEAWLCWNCSKHSGKDFVLDTRPVDLDTFPHAMYVAVDDSLEYYYKYNVVHKKGGRRGRRIKLLLQTGANAERDVVEVSFDKEDGKIWRGDLSRRTKIGWIGLMEPAGGTDLKEYPVPLVPMFHLSRERGKPVVSRPPPPVYRRGFIADRGIEDEDDGSKSTLTGSPESPDLDSEDIPVAKLAKSDAKRERETSTVSRRDSFGASERMLEVADILSTFASINKGKRRSIGGNEARGAKADNGTNNETNNETQGFPNSTGNRAHVAAVSTKGCPPDPAGGQRQASHHAPPPQSTGAKMTDCAMEIDVNDDVEVWVNETNIGPGGWMPGKVAERVLVDPKGYGSPYFAFYTVDMLPILNESVELKSRGTEMRLLMQVRRPLAVPILGSAGYAALVRKPRTTPEQHSSHGFKKGDRVEAIVCGRYAPGTVIKDTKHRSKLCRIKFDHPAKEKAYKETSISQPIETVRLDSPSPQYYGMLHV